MKKHKNHPIIHIVVMALAIIIGAGFIPSTVYDAKYYYLDTHADFVQEYATIVRYERFARYGFDESYSTFYEYEADGVVYYGLWQRLIYDEEDAKAQIGKKVPIYVDHALKHHKTNLNIAKSPIGFAGVFVLVCFLIFLNSFIRETIFIVRWAKNKKAIKKSTKENVNDA